MELFYVVAVSGLLLLLACYLALANRLVSFPAPPLTFALGHSEFTERDDGSVFTCSPVQLWKIPHKLAFSSALPCSGEDD